MNSNNGNYEYSNCKGTDHQYKDCPEIECKECKEKKHIKKYCSNKQYDKN
ncbi:13229_t:CDS:1, partial [Entrophospora sp. SA101]